MNGYNFSERVRLVLASTRKIAAELGSEYVRPEHILLAILDAEECLGLEVLRALRCDPAVFAAETRRIVRPADSPANDSVDLIYTAEAKRVLDLAMEEARALGHDYVGTDHLLLGLVGGGEDVAARALNAAGVKLVPARDALILLRASAPRELEYPRIGFFPFVRRLFARRSKLAGRAVQ